ncbi:MAG TPA: cyclic nucleotide-binding domain-containing protein, partial [Desulfobacterales bacterium]|nr:cyclic nucleotide-binding domain-containing protein [Desulfobacterales bacterium]
LGDCACSEDSKLRERAVMALSLCMVGLRQQDQDHPDLVKLITEVLLRWLRAETVFLSVCGTVSKQLQEYGVRMLEEGLWDECEYLLEVFHQIQSGILVKSNAIRSIVSRSQEAMATDYILEELTIVCLRGRGNRRQKAEKILIQLGRKAAVHILETLLASQEKEDRLRLIGLIPATGHAAVSVLKEYLQKDLPWYGIRNIILMITAMDEPDLIPLIMPCLEHEDIRIQQQVLDCISEVAVENQSDYLLTALPIVTDDLKVSLIGYLGQLGGVESTEAFLDLLSKRDSFSPNVKDKLLQSLAIQVRLSDSIRAVNMLNMILAERKNLYDPNSDPVTQVVNQTLQILAPRFKQEELSEDTGKYQQEEAISLAETVSFGNSPETLAHAKRQVQKINEEVTSLLGSGKTAEASQFLFKKCVEAAKDKQFEIAEMLRDRILEVDPNALTEVINAGEVIEKEQSASISSNHISIWQDLYDSLTTEEFNALYHSLTTADYLSGDVIVKQGTNTPLLFFINSGVARLACWRGKDEIFLKKIGPGEIVGAGPFFDVSTWTVSLTSLGQTNVQILEREKFLELLEQFPGLEPCLVNYCLKSESVPDLLEMSGEDRREHPRYPVSIIVMHTLLNESGNNSMRNFKGEISDISCGGLTFFIRISRKENARLLLGRGIKTSLSGLDGEQIECVGQIVAVRFQHVVESDYSV